MQEFNKIQDTTYISDAPDMLNKNFQSVASDFAGTSFPTTDLVEGMTCYRTDEGIKYRYIGGKWVSSFATQAEAEGGSDETKAMTPLQTKNAINKQRPLKTYTTFEQLGYSAMPTLETLVSDLPSFSKFVRYLNQSEAETLGLPDYGILEITKAQYIDFASLYLQRRGGESYFRRAYFENWARGQNAFQWKRLLANNNIATQSQAEEGTDNDTVMTPLQTKNAINKQRPLKTYTTFEQLGFTSVPALKDLLEALPADCEFTRYVNATNASIMGLPNGCILKITKGTLRSYAKITCNRGVGTDHRMWFENWEAGQSTFDWKEIARATPTLTSEQKTQIKNLAKAYLDNTNGTFFYYGDLVRNDYATNNSWILGQDRWGINCETFVEMVWMGRDVNDFKGKTASTYSPNITKAFDWGYYWEFKNRTLLAGLAKRDENGEITGYYGFQQPNKDDEENPYKGSYSYNTSYHPNSNNLYKQSFRGFMVAGDMAYELWKMGCEIPISELDVGDIIFNASEKEVYGARENYISGCWKRISHVSMVYNKANDGTLTIIESSDWYNSLTNAITTVNEKSSFSVERLRAFNIQQTCVKAFRHPAAFGKGGNVPDAITVVPKAYEG